MNNDMYKKYPPMMEYDKKLARAYIPYQVMGKVYTPEEALKKGTLFPELYMPYVPEKKSHK